MSTPSYARKSALRLMTLISPVLFSIGAPLQVDAQGLIEKMTKAAKGFASVTTEAGMIGAVSVDLETRNLPTIAVGETTLGVSQVDFKESIGVRVHLYYLNATDQPISLAMPNDQTFALVDSKGRRLLFLALRFKDVPKGASSLIVPALERVNLTVLYTLPAGASGEAILKVGTAGMIRGIPLGDGQSSAPGLAVTSSPSVVQPAVPPIPPPDSTSSSRRSPSTHNEGVI